MGLLRQGVNICLEITIVDGLVLADSLFSHSMNFRSVMIFGRGSEVKNLKDKSHILTKFSEKIVPGRGDDAREPSEIELKQTGLFGFNFDKASAKIRKGPPSKEDEEAYQSSWTGVIPVSEQWGIPIPTERCLDHPLPEYIKDRIE